MTNRRVFLAIPREPEALQQWRAFQKDLQKHPFFRKIDSDCRWVSVADFHLTLHFLGERSSSFIEQLVEEVKLLLKTPPPEGLQRMNEFLAFPKSKAARVAGIGSHQVLPRLAELHAQLGRKLGELGITVEKRPFLPHLTLVRLRSPKNFEAFFMDLGYLPAFPVQRVALFESHLGREGARYEILQDFLLAPA